MVPPSPPLPTACSLRFHPSSGSHTSTRMSESDVGVSRADTRQNAGRSLNAAALPGDGGVKLPGCTDSDVSVAFGTARLPNAAHVVGAAAATRAAGPDPPKAQTTNRFNSVKRLVVRIVCLPLLEKRGHSFTEIAGLRRKNLLAILEGDHGFEAAGVEARVEAFLR